MDRFFPSTFQSGAPQIRSVCSELSRRGATPDGLARPIDHLISSPAARARNTNLPDLLLRLLKLHDCFRPGLAYSINCVIKCDFAYGVGRSLRTNTKKPLSSVPFSIHPGRGGEGAGRNRKGAVVGIRRSRLPPQVGFFFSHRTCLSVFLYPTVRYAGHVVYA